MSIGARIQKLRKKQNLTQEGLAEQLEVTRQVVSKWECEQSMPSSEMIIRMSQIFSVSTDYLLGMDVQEPVLSGEEKSEEFSDEEQSEAIVECPKQNRFSKWIAFAFGVVAFILAIKFLSVMCRPEIDGEISLLPGITVAVLAILTLVMRIRMLIKKQWSYKVHEFIISYVTYLLAICAGIWSVYLLWCPLGDIGTYAAWFVFIVLVVLMYVSRITAIVFGVIIAVRLLLWYLKKR